MKTITKEQIDQAILSATKKMIENMPNQYANAIEETDANCDIDVKNNAYAREEIAISIAQSNAICVFKDVLYNLFLYLNQ